MLTSRHIENGSGPSVPVSTATVLQHRFRVQNLIRPTERLPPLPPKGDDGARTPGLREVPRDTAAERRLGRFFGQASDSP
jgi:hypothetical protein